MFWRCASTPGYDPNLFNVGISNDQWRTLTSDDHKPLLNKVMGGAYPPGSTFKPAMALAAMDNGLADLQVNCTGSMTFGNHDLHCWSWKKGGHGHVDLHRGIQVSCDIFFYEVARRLGIDKMEQAARALGLGAPTGIELPGELGGFIPSRSLETGEDRCSLAAGRYAERRHRPGLCDDHAASTLHAGRAAGERQGGLPAHHPSGRCDAAAAPGTGGAAILGRGVCRRARGHECGNERSRAARLMPIALPNRASRWRARRARPRCGVITHAERESGVKRMPACPGICAIMASSSPSRRSTAPRYACGIIVEHGADGPSAGAGGARHPFVRPAARSLEIADGLSALSCRDTRLQEWKADMMFAPLCRRAPHAFLSRQAQRDQLGPGAADQHHRLRRFCHAVFGGRRLAVALGRQTDDPLRHRVFSDDWRGDGRYPGLDELRLSRLHCLAHFAGRRGSRRP